MQREEIEDYYKARGMKLEENNKFLFPCAIPYCRSVCQRLKETGAVHNLTITQLLDIYAKALEKEFKDTNNPTFLSGEEEYILIQLLNYQASLEYNLPPGLKQYPIDNHFVDNYYQQEKQKMNRIIIMYGLPASGKTTWANQYYKNLQAAKDSKKVKYLDLDRLTKLRQIESKKLEEDKEDILTSLKSFLVQTGVHISNKYLPNYIIVDGLFLTTRNVIDFLETTEIKNGHVEIHYWIPNREQCLRNDSHRRDIDSSITIKNAHFEYPGLAQLSSLFPSLTFEVMQHRVPEKDPYKIFAAHYNLYLEKDKYLYSDSWSLGGTYGSCWNNKLNSISPGEPLTSFSEFDELIEVIAPNITMMRYKNLYNKTVSIKRESDGDYYGGVEYTARYSCDVQLLYRLLVEKGLIKEEY